MIYIKLIAEIEKYKAIIKKKRKRHDEIVSLAINKLDIIEVLISKNLINSYTSQDESFSANNVLKEDNEMKETNKSSNKKKNC